MPNNEAVPPRTDDEDAASPAEGGGLLASSLADYLKAWWANVRAGRSGMVPVLVGLVIIVVIFQAENSAFLSAGNLVDLMTQAATFVLFGMAEIFLLVLGEIDLSIGYVAGVGATIMAEVAAPPRAAPWWIAVLAALAATTVIGAFQGTLITRFGLPAFIVTLGGLLSWEGVMLFLLDRDAAAGGTIGVTNNILYDIVNGNLSNLGGWLVAAGTVIVFGAYFLLRDHRRRLTGLAAPPVGLTVLKVGAVATGALFVVLICNSDRGRPGIALSGMSWVVPMVLAVLVGYTFFLVRTRFGHYVYAIGGNAEAARRAGVNLPRIRTACFALGGFTGGLGGIVYASRLGSISTSMDGGSLVLYAVAAAVIGGTSLFGGRGKMVHALVGGVVIATIYNGMGLLGLGSAAQYTVTGVVLVVAVLVDALNRRGRPSPVR